MSVQDDDRDVFDAATSDEPPKVEEGTADEPVEAAEAEEPDAPEEDKAEAEDKPPRNDKGQFAAKAEEPEEPEQPEAEKPAEPEPAPKQEDHRVPLSEHLSEREKRQKAEAEARRFREQLEAFQKEKEQKPPPDMYEDPAGYQQYQQQSIQDTIRATELKFSERFARLKYGDDVYQAAEAAANEVMASGAHDPMLAAVARSSDPGSALVEWHKRNQTMERLGSTDLDTFLEQQKEQLLSDPQFLSQAVERARADAPKNPGSPKPAKQIPSLNRATAAQSNETEVKDVSDAELFKSFG